VPSRYALRVGEIDVLVISDGVFPLPATTLATNADPADLAAWLDDTVVLVRGHANTAASASVAGPGVVDVTTYPDLAELFLAADVPVSDHSAVLFDFVLTDKPVVLLAPDLEEYQAGDRGLYVDLLADAPGPVVSTPERLVPALEAGDAHAEDRHRMREAYGELEDGGATRRLLELLFPAARD
jgi:CDP-glycerol glycerophosphotransferase